MKPRIAVIGTGVAGLGCAYQLRSHANLTLIERNHYVGGHSNTIDVREGTRNVPIDTGFIVFNKVTYPNLLKLFQELDVPIKKAEMSFSAQHVPDGIEYNGMSLKKVFAQRRNAFKPRFLRFLAQTMGFFKIARASLTDPSIEKLTMREFAARHGFGREFMEYYLVPMSSAVWSTDPRKVLDFPICTLIRFFENHGFLGVNSHHQWWTVDGGARTYVRKLLGQLETTPRVEKPAVAVTETGSGAEIHFADGSRERFDKVILATHGDEALDLLATPTPLQQRLLSPFGYQKNRATLHTDASVMPKRRIAWASWNYRVEHCPDGHLRPTTHYWMNALQGVSDRQDYFVSINGEDLVDPESILYSTDYDHPVFTPETAHAQTELPSLNQVSPTQSVYFCGSYFRYGFHEDAYSSGLDCALMVKSHSVPV